MKWRIQFIFLVVSMFGLILGGIHLAEKGIQRVEGTQDGPAQSFHIARLENGRLDMTVLGRDYSLDKEAISPVIETFSAAGDSSTEQEHPSSFSEMGNWIATSVQKLLHGVFD